jgi:hypothetical protein
MGRLSQPARDFCVAILPWTAITILLKKNAQAPPNGSVYVGEKSAAKSENPRGNGVKAFEKSVFGPCTIGRTGAPVQNHKPSLGN